MAAAEGEPEARPLDITLLRRTWAFARPYKRLIIWALLAVPFAGAAQLVQPYIIKTAIDNHFTPGKFDGLETLALMYGCALLADFFFMFVQLYYMNLAGQRAMHDLRKELFQHVIGLDAAFFRKQPVGKLLTRMTNDVESLNEMFAAGVVALISDVMILVAIVVILFSINAKLAALGFFAVPALYLFANWTRRHLRETYRDVRHRMAGINAFLNENITGMRIVQLFVREDVNFSQFRGNNEGYRDATVRALKLDAVLYAVVEMASSITLAAILWFAAGEIFEGALTFGLLVAFIEWMQRFFIPLRDISAKFAILQSAMAGAERIFGLLVTSREIYDKEGAPELAPLRDGIELAGVDFEYRPGEPVLRGIDLKIAHGERIAIVGRTGSGKTTLTKLINRSYDPTRGAIFFDGTDIRFAQLGSVRRRTAVVHQDVFIFAGDAASNISLGDPDMTRSQIEAAARMVHADKFITRLPGKYSSPLGERGNNLSAGERQLLSFARAQAAEPDVLILDEATSNVDPETEALVQDALENLTARRTSIIIAHRLATVRKAGRILVVHGGKIVEEGKHEELLKRDGVYAKLYRLQFAGQESGAPAR